MIKNDDIEQLFQKILVSDFSGLEAKHIYAMAELAYKKGIDDAANKCEQRAESLPPEQCGIARLCKRDVMSLL
jgi:hypothetical protein